MELIEQSKQERATESLKITPTCAEYIHKHRKWKERFSETILRLILVSD